MFPNNKITISSQNEDRTLTTIYSNIRAQIFKQTLRFDWSVWENTVRDITVIYIDPDKLNVREWNIVTYTDKFQISRKLKVTNIDFIDMMYFKKVIELKCDLI